MRATSRYTTIVVGARRRYPMPPPLVHLSLSHMWTYVHGWRSTYQFIQVCCQCWTFGINIQLNYLIKSVLYIYKLRNNVIKFVNGNNSLQALFVLN